MRRLRVFVPHSADVPNTNAQSLTLKEIVSRLPPDEFEVVMLTDAFADPRITNRPNTELVRWRRRGSTAFLLYRFLHPLADVYFYPRTTALDDLVLFMRKRLRLKTAVVCHVTWCLRPQDATGTLAKTLVDADAVFGNSHYVTETVRTYRPDATTIFNGIDRRFYFAAPENTQGAQENRKLTVAYAGSFQARKRPELVIRQAARRPDVLFRLAGKGELLNECQDLARQLKCENVEFLGSVSPAHLGENPASSGCVLFPQHSRGTSPGSGPSGGVRCPVRCHEYLPSSICRAWGNWLAGGVGCGTGKALEYFDGGLRSEPRFRWRRDRARSEI